MSRALVISGLPLPNGRHIQGLPFRVQPLGDDDAHPELEPTGSTPGEWALMDGVNVFCVSEDTLVAYSALYRRWKTRFSMVGKYVAYNEFDGPGDLTGFSFDATNAAAVDVVKFAHTADERYLGHGRSLFLFLGGFVDDHTTSNGVLNLGYEHVQVTLDPTNTGNPLDLFDVDPLDGVTKINPLVYYSNVLDAFYIIPTGSAGITVRNRVTGADHSYDVVWTPGPPSGDPNSAVYHAIFSPFPDIPGNLTWPADFEPEIDTFILNIESTDTAGFFPHKTLEDTAPVWDEDSGAQLITPVPLVQD